MERTKQRRVVSFDQYAQSNELNLNSKPAKVEPKMKSPNIQFCERCTPSETCQLKISWEKAEWYRNNTIKYQDLAEEIFTTLRDSAQNFREKGCPNVNKIITD
jgi:hypothetical protein